MIRSILKLLLLRWTFNVNGFRSSSAFSIRYSVNRPAIQRQQQQILHVALVPPDDDNSYFLSPFPNAIGAENIATSILSSETYALNKEECNPIIRIGKDTDKEKVINGFGLWCLIVSLLTGPIWMLAMVVINKIYDIYPNWDIHRSIYDTTGKVWAKVWLTGTNSYPTISGDTQFIQSTRNGNAKNQPCLYVSNHASWLDIPVLCTVLDPVFKFIAKGELRKVPCIGQQLEGGQHILIDRDDRKSQLRTFKDGIAWLQKGVPIMAFPEGMRSNDGRLMEFKKGLFSLAVKTNVPIVPITLCHTNNVMPIFSYFPIQSGAGKIHVHIGSPIYPNGKTEIELEELVRQEFISHLPKCQHPLVIDKEEALTTASPGTASDRGQPEMMVQK